MAKHTSPSPARRATATRAIAAAASATSASAAVLLPCTHFVRAARGAPIHHGGVAHLPAVAARRPCVSLLNSLPQQFCQRVVRALLLRVSFADCKCGHPVRRVPDMRIARMEVHHGSARATTRASAT